MSSHISAPAAPLASREGRDGENGEESLQETRAKSLQEFVAVARSFWLIPELIPRGDRLDVAVLYSFCRTLDDAIDESQPERAARELSDFRQELFAGGAPRPLIVALLDVVRRRALPQSCLEELLLGMQGDLGCVRIETDAELVRYAYQVSSSVGLLLAPLLGMRGEAASYRIVDWGVALQISNVLLGVRADAERGRVYVPRTRLRAEGMTQADVLSGSRPAAMGRALRGLAQLADRYYRSAEQGVSLVPLRYRHGVLLLGRVYRELGWRAASGAFAPVAPSGLSFAARFRHLLGLIGAALEPQAIGWFAPAPHDRELHAVLEPTWFGAHR